MQYFKLIDMKPRSRIFTWSNRRLGAAFVSEHLDKFVVSDTCISLHWGFTSKILHSGAWDHRPVSLDLVSLPRPCKVSFKFNPLLCQEEEFQNNVRRWWREGALSFGS
eukprot:Gb_27286 [translate_table: standard]